MVYGSFMYFVCILKKYNNNDCFIENYITNKREFNIVPNIKSLPSHHPLRFSKI